MQNSFTDITNGIVNKEWSSFCSSCKSVLQSICSVGEPFSLDEIIDESTKEDLKMRIEKYGNTVEAKDAINKKTNEHISNNYINGKEVAKPIINYTGNNSLITEKNSDKLDSHTNKRIKRIELLNTADTYPFNMNKNSSNNINSMKITYVQSIEQQEKYRTFKKRILLQDAGENIQPINDSFFVSNLISPMESQTVAENILYRRKNILKITQSILHLSNYIDRMRKMILQGIHKEQTVQKCQKDINKVPSDNNNDVKTLASQGLPMYYYNSLCINKK